MTNTILLLKTKYDNYYRMAKEKYDSSFEGWSYFGDGGRGESFNIFNCPLIFDLDTSNTLSEEKIILFETEHKIILPVEYREFLKYVANGQRDRLPEEQFSVCEMRNLSEVDSYPTISSEELNFYKRSSGISKLESVNRTIALGNFDEILEILQEESKINLSSDFRYEKKYNEELLEPSIEGSMRIRRGDLSEPIKDIEWQSINIAKIENSMKNYFQKSNIDGCIIVAKSSEDYAFPIYFLLVVNGKEYGNIWVDMRLINKGIVPYDESFREFFCCNYYFKCYFLFEVRGNKNRYNFVEFIDDCLSERLEWYEGTSRILEKKKHE